LYSYRGYPVVKTSTGYYKPLKFKYSASLSSPEEVEIFIDKYINESKKVTESYEWDSDWEEAFPGSSTKIKGYADNSKDLSSQIVGDIYPPDDVFPAYAAEIWDNSIADQVEVKEGFETEEDAKKWVEDWFKENESSKIVKESLTESSWRDTDIHIDDLKRFRDTLNDLIEEMENNGQKFIHTQPNTYGLNDYIGTRLGYIDLEDIYSHLYDNDLDESLKLSLKEDVEETLPGPDEENINLADMITTGVKDEYDTIALYNNIAMVARQEGRTDIADLIDNINTEENNHVGMLQSALKTLSKNADAIESGDEEAKEYLGESFKLELKESNSNLKLELKEGHTSDYGNVLRKAGSYLKGGTKEAAEKGEKIGNFSVFRFGPNGGWVVAHRRLPDGEWVEDDVFTSEKKAKKYATKHSK
jgi:rubrerythrin